MLTNNKAAAVLFLRAQTPLHAGSGAPSGAIDMAIQREVHTQWPTIHSTGIKGVLRDAYRRLKMNSEEPDAKKANSNVELTAIFGPAKASTAGEGHAGCLTITDARILAFPVTSDRGVFAWIACAAVFERLHSDLKLLGLDACPLLDEPGENAIALADPSRTTANGVMLRDVEYSVTKREEATRKLQAAAKWVAENACGINCSEAPRSIFDPRVGFAQVSSDDFTHFVKYATEVISRNALDEETRTVKRGALFMQEFLPAETILYSLILAGKPRKQVNGLATGEDVRKKVCNVLCKESLQIGADETTGKGWCSARIMANPAEGTVS